MYRYARAVVVMSLWVILTSCLLQAQFENGSIVGTITDSSGAALPGATVTVTNIGTGVISKRVTNTSGNYEIPALRVGQYNVLVSRDGFAAAEAKNITVSVASRQRVDLVLKVGSVGTSIEVSSQSLTLDTDSSQRSQIITNEQTAAFPLVNRNYSDLVALIPGARQTIGSMSGPSNSGLVREGSYNVNGQRSMFNNFLLDGMDNNAYGESNQGFSNQIIQPAPDSIAQFQVVTDNQSAEYGRASGATVNVAFASGTNQFHGRVYEFFRNTSMNAIGFFQPPGGKPVFNRNQFGGDTGGPIIKNHLFFFLDYEGFRQIRKSVSTKTLPTDSQRQGIFSKTVYSPYTGTAYAAGTSILSDPDISALAKQIVGYLPANTNNEISSNYSVLQRFSNYSDKGDLRLDWHPSQKDSFFTRISDLKQDAVDFPVFPLPIDGGSNGAQRILDQQVALGWTRVVGPNRLLDARLGLSRTKAGKYSLSIGDNVFSIPGLPTDPNVAGGLPSTSISGFSSIGRQSTNPQYQNPALLDPKVNYFWVIGRHSLKVGYEFEHIWMAVQDTNPLYGSFAFSGGFSRKYANGKTSESASADNYFADFLWGASSSYRLASYFAAHLRNHAHYAYIQDDIRVNSRLTVNAGLRYEYGSPYTEQHLEITNFDPATQTLISASNGSIYNKSLVNPDRNNFAPRLGFSFSLGGKTTLRGGYGMSYSRYDRAGSGNILALNAPQALFATATQVAPSAGGDPSSFRPIDTGFPADMVSASNFDQLTDNITYIPKSYPDSYIHSYYFGVQHQLFKNAIVDVAYVGNHGLKLLELANYNQKQIVNGAFVRPIPAWGDITIAMKSGYSHYDALQAKYEQHMVEGLTLLNSFAWSHARDNAGASLESSTPAPQNYYDLAGDYGQSDYNQPIVNTTSLVYDLPFGRGRRWMNAGGIANQAFGGWQVSAINQAQSGFPFNLTYGPTSSNQVSNISSSYRGSNLYRPNRIPGKTLTSLSKASSNGTSIQYVNLDAVSIPPTKDIDGNPVLPFGDISRNPGRSPTYNNLNIAFNKRFDTPLESLKIEFRGEMYNAFNHTNFSTPGGGISGSASMPGSEPTPATSGGRLSSTFDPRIIQFGLKVMF